MYKKLVGAMYVLNIVFQSFFTLLTPVALCFFLSWLLVSYASAPKWIYAPLLVLGVLSGFYSMIRFVLTAMAGFERLESEQNGKSRSSAHATENISADKNCPKGNNNEEK